MIKMMINDDVIVDADNDGSGKNIKCMHISWYVLYFSFLVLD